MKFTVGDKVQTTELWNKIHTNDPVLRGVELEVTGYSQGFVCVSGYESIQRFHEDNLELRKGQVQ